MVSSQNATECVCSWFLQIKSHTYSNGDSQDIFYSRIVMSQNICPIWYLCIIDILLLLFLIKLQAGKCLYQAYTNGYMSSLLHSHLHVTIL